MNIARMMFCVRVDSFGLVVPSTCVVRAAIFCLGLFQRQQRRQRREANRFGNRELIVRLDILGVHRKMLVRFPLGEFLPGERFQSGREWPARRNRRRRHTRHGILLHPLRQSLRGSFGNSRLLQRLCCRVDRCRGQTFYRAIFGGNAGRRRSDRLVAIFCQRFSRQNNRHMPFRRRRVSGTVFESPWRSILRRWKFAPESTIASAPSAATAIVPPASPAGSEIAPPSITAMAVPAIFESRTAWRRVVARFLANNRRRQWNGIGRWLQTGFFGRAERHSFYIRWFQRRNRNPGRRKDLSALRFHLLDFVLDGGDDVVEILNFFQEIAHVQESVAIEANLHKGGLHTWQHASNFAFVDAPN